MLKFRCFGIGVLVFVLSLFLGCSMNEDYSRDKKWIVKRLEQLENRIEQIAGQTNELQKFKSQVNEYRKLLEERLDKLDPGKPLAKGEGTYHEVGSGDTLFRVAEKHGVSVEELRRLNNLKKGQAIFPKQRLLITPGRTSK